MKTIAGWASGRRTKWWVVGFWVFLLTISTLPGQLTEVTEDRISSFLPDDEVCLHLFEAPSADAVSEAMRRAALAVDRIVETVE